MQRRAKIGATLGPASDDERTLAAVVEAGLDVARINFSHGDVADHRKRVRRVRSAARRLGRSLAVLADLQGPRLRVGKLPDGRLRLEEGSRVTLVAGRERSEPGTVPVSHPALAAAVKKGDRVFLDDGNTALRVLSVRGERVRCRVDRPGTISDRKGINLPDGGLPIATLTAKDRRDLRQAVELGADWLAVSFVRDAEDVRTARRLLKRAGSSMPVMAKIEQPEAVDRLDAILEAADGLLVARGDLGVELPPERVPILQKQMIEAANALGKPVMTATQMLESMRFSPRPTRAEASDVANAVLDGSSCLLLTAETAAGSFPVEAVRMMARIIGQAEASGRGHPVGLPEGELSVPEATCRAACRAARDVGARYVVVFTESGFSARQVARFRARTPILAFTPSREIQRRLHMYWGVEPRTLPSRKTIDQLLIALDRSLLDTRLARRRDLVIVVCGAPVGVQGSTNLIKVHRVGSAASDLRRGS